ncbi:MAG: Na+/H+ antiporter subunit E [Schwartzia sp. (in: firmicutes)]
MTAFSPRHGKGIVGAPMLHMGSLAIMLFAFWLLLTGSIERKFLTYGVLTALITAWVTYPLLLIPNDAGTKKYFLLGVNPGKLVLYLLWLFWQLVLANLDVLKATVRPEIEIAPRIVRFRYQAENPIAKVCLANSITLTPGTVTIEVTEDGVFTVHALTDGAADGLKDGAMQGKVAWLFNTPYTFAFIGEEV